MFQARTKPGTDESASPPIRTSSSNKTEPGEADMHAIVARTSNPKLNPGRTSPKHPTKQILGVQIGVFSSVGQAAEVAVDMGGSDEAAKTVLTCNVDHVIRMRDDAEFRACYDDASLVTADGAPVVWLSALIGRSVGPRVTGAELLPSFGRVCAARGLRLAVMGGAAHVSDEAVRRLSLQNPELDAVSVPAPGPGFVIGSPQDQEFLTVLQAARADIIVVCFGAPTQELWMRHHRAALPGCVLIGAGAAVDFMAGSKKRAPSWVQRVGAEWIYRLCGDFHRLWRRYLLHDTAFVGVAAAELWNVRGPGRLRRKPVTKQ